MLKISNFFSKILIALIHFYQLVTPKWIHYACRFEPTCSDYAILSLKKYGLMRGIFLSLLRICRCFPPNGGRDYP